MRAQQTDLEAIQRVVEQHNERLAAQGSRDDAFWAACCEDVCRALPGILLMAIGTWVLIAGVLGGLN